MDYEESLMIKAAWYYYFEEMTQQHVAELMGITRMRVISCWKRPGRRALSSSGCARTAKAACSWRET